MKSETGVSFLGKAAQNDRKLLDEFDPILGLSEIHNFTAGFSLSATRVAIRDPGHGAPLATQV